MQYSARGRKLTYSSKAIVQFILPLVAWMALVILTDGLSYNFIGDSIPRLDEVNGGSRVQAYSKYRKMLAANWIFSLCTEPVSVM